MHINFSFYPVKMRYVLLQRVTHQGGICIFGKDICRRFKNEIYRNSFPIVSYNTNFICIHNIRSKVTSIQYSLASLYACMLVWRYFSRRAMCRNWCFFFFARLKIKRRISHGYFLYTIY